MKQPSHDMVMDVGPTDYQEFFPRGMELELRSKTTGQQLTIHLTRKAALELALAAYDITDTWVGRLVAQLLWRTAK